MPILTSNNLAQFFDKPIIKALGETQNALTFEDDYGCNILHFAAHLGKLDTVQYLLEHYPQLNKIAFNTGKPPVLNWSILHFATNEGHQHLVEFLLTKYPDTKHSPDALGNNLMHHAARSGQVEVFERVVQHFGGLDSLTNRYGQNLLHRAACSGSEDLIFHLLMTYPKKMALMWVKDNHGHFPDQVTPSSGENNAAHPLRSSQLWSTVFTTLFFRCPNNTISTEDKLILTAFISQLTLVLNNVIALIKNQEVLENMLNLECLWDFVGSKKMKPFIAVQIFQFKLTTETLTLHHIKELVTILDEARFARTYLSPKSQFHQALSGVQTLQDLHKIITGNETTDPLESTIKTLLLDAMPRATTNTAEHTIAVNSL